MTPKLVVVNGGPVPLTSDLASKLAALRKQKTWICRVCGKEFVTVARAFYCSNRCKQRRKYRLLRQQAQERQQLQG